MVSCERIILITKADVEISMKLIKFASILISKTFEYFMLPALLLWQFYKLFFGADRCEEFKVY